MQRSTSVKLINAHDATKRTEETESIRKGDLQVVMEALEQIDSRESPQREREQECEAKQRVANKLRELDRLVGELEAEQKGTKRGTLEIRRKLAEGRNNGEISKRKLRHSSLTFPQGERIRELVTEIMRFNREAILGNFKVTE